MPRKQDTGDAARADQRLAQREREARDRLLDLGADALAPRPWRPPPVPASAVDLAQFALWRSSDLSREGILAALALLPAARAEVDQLEAGLLFAARTAGLTWAEMAETMGLGSPQACQQRYGRLTTRQDSAS
ncbi:DNA-binding protein [Polymorphospora sp. NPDC050346]|uniref:DNA-binding protein n=1 Tax=Polymorphospora sp. NPDC050346 TaxID=3155780 RepID=UPI00340C1AD6